MESLVDAWMSHPLLAVLAYFSVGVFALIVFLAIFELVTKYDGWAEIRKGNVAAAMATGGKIFGICNIFRFSIQANISIYASLIWAGVGFALLLAAYFLFEFLTPVFRIDEEIAKDNRAVGLLAMIISVSLSYIIGAAVT
jgi:putative membrane protein